ncbi:unnamed protein product [Amaranthus hypochondriacus]
MEEPLPPDDLRCKRTDGRHWRCKRKIVDGKSFCLSHLHRSQNKRPTSIPNPNPLPDPEPVPKPRVRIRLIVKPEPQPEPKLNPLPEPEPIDEFEFNPPPEPVPVLVGTVQDDLRCSKNDGKDWRCKNQALDAQTLCEIHLIKPKVQSQRRPRPGPIITPVPENLRCTRNNGKDWRCKNKVVEGFSHCETHMKRNNNSRRKKKEKHVCAIEEDSRKEVEKTPVPVAVPVPNTPNHGNECRSKERILHEQILREDDIGSMKIKDLADKEKGSKKRKKNSNNKSTQVVFKVENEVEKEKMSQVSQVTVAVEGEKEKMSRVSEVAVTVEEELRCKRTDGRGWRCKRRVLEGKTLCEIHYEQGRLRQQRITVPDELKILRGEGSEEVEKRLKRKKEIETLENNSNKGMKRMKAELIRGFLRREIIESTKKSEKQIGVDSEEVTRDLPYGSMAIPPVPPNQALDGAVGSLGIKIGGHCSSSLVTRRFRSKNIEPPPIGAVKILPFPKKVDKVKSRGRKKCHWCRKFDNLCLIKCLSCKKQYFCSNCIKERSADLEEVKLRCPVCRKCCHCKICCTARSKDLGSKVNNDVLKENLMGGKFQHLQYLINFLLPILVQINQEQGVEVELEAKFRGQNPSDVEIRQADVGCRDQCRCNNCKSPILDFHRSCPNCSYNLCLSCCREYAHVGSLGGGQPNGAKMLFPCQKSSKKNLDVASSAPLQDSTASLHVSCPPMELGGCDNSLLDLRCIFPLNWTKELEISAAETVSEYDFLQNTDNPVHCSMCTSISKAGNKSNELLQVSRRKESNDNLLYCPCASDNPSCLLAHFQKHWRMGHPVKVRNVLHCAFALSWDPLAMFCSYLEKGFSSKSTEESIEAASCSGSYDVEVGIKELFTGSIQEGYMNVRRETLKLKAKISTDFSQKLLEGCYSKILHALPLQEYTNPRVGLLNIAGKLPEYYLDSILGPHVCISCGSRDEVARGELVTKLYCNSFDEVNILVHVGDATCSSEQLEKMKKLIKRNSNLKDLGGQTSNKNLEDDDTRLHSEVSVEAGERHGVVGACCSAAANDASVINNRGDDKSPPAKLVHGSDTDSDASMICSRASHSPDKDVDQIPHQDLSRSLNANDKQSLSEHCGAQWDVFRRQDVSKLLEYLSKHENEIRLGSGLSNKVVHPIFDGSLYLDTVHKMQLKQEFEIEPWTFNQCLGEAVFIPAGCPYQIKHIKSCVNVTVGFISPENASECIKLINEIRVLPNNHKAKQVTLEVEKMAICSVDEAIKEIYRLKSEEGIR